MNGEPVPFLIGSKLYFNRKALDAFLASKEPIDPVPESATAAAAAALVAAIRAEIAAGK